MQYLYNWRIITSQNQQKKQLKIGNSLEIHD